MNDQSKSPLGTVIMWAIIIVGGLVWYANSTYTETTTQTIPCSYQTVQNSSMYEGQSKTIQFCKNGTRTIKTTYSRWDNSQKGEPVTVSTVAAKNQITAVGTAKKPALPLYTAPSGGGGGRTGAVCRDGWNSSATGSGACSHHGGVAYWTY